LKKVIIIVLLVFVLFLSGCAELQQSGSHMKSSLVGINREITLYGNNGGKIQNWVGKLQVEVEGASARFMYNGKAITIAGTFIIKEI